MPARKERGMGFWGKLRRLLVFQIKLYADAGRDILLSFLSLWIFLLDVILGKGGKDSYFQQLMRLGRWSDKAINLFEEHDEEHDAQNLDAIINTLEDKVRKDIGIFDRDGADKN